MCTHEEKKEKRMKSQNVRREGFREEHGKNICEVVLAFHAHYAPSIARAYVCQRGADERARAPRTNARQAFFNLLRASEELQSPLLLEFVMSFHAHKNSKRSQNNKERGAPASQQLERSRA